MSIYFYSTRGRYGCFSNFASYEIELDGKRWPTTEHYFQAQKFADIKYCEAIRNAPSPMKAAQMGRSRNHKIHPNWENIKYNVMKKAVLKKFETHIDIKEILFATGNNEIIENTRDDYYWGSGRDGTGKNMLGKILMETREKLRTQKEKMGSALDKGQI